MLDPDEPRRELANISDRVRIRNPGRAASKIVGRLLDLYACEFCTEMLSFRLVEKNIKMHDKCLHNYKVRQAKQRLVAAAAKATGAELIPA